MQSLNTYKYITSPATTTFAGETGRIVLGSININKTLVGTLTIQASGSTIGVFAVGTAVGEYWYTNTGTEIESLTIVNSGIEDITVLYRNI
jgi:dolichol kinase